MLFQINFMLAMFEDYSISIGPLIDNLSTTSQILIIFIYTITHKIP